MINWLILYLESLKIIFVPTPICYLGLSLFLIYYDRIVWVSNGQRFLQYPKKTTALMVLSHPYGLKCQLLLCVACATCLEKLGVREMYWNSVNSIEILKKLEIGIWNQVKSLIIIKLLFVWPLSSIILSFTVLLMTKISSSTMLQAETWTTFLNSIFDICFLFGYLFPRMYLIKCFDLSIITDWYYKWFPY